MSTDQRFLYRGIHAGHPAFSDALRGIVRPGDVDGTVSVRDHNLGGYSAESPYTSWTTDRQSALRYASRKGPGGIVLIVPIGAPQAGDSWRWEWSDDEYLENEILLYGIRVGVEAIKL